MILGYPHFWKPPGPQDLMMNLWMTRDIHMPAVFRTPGTVRRQIALWFVHLPSCHLIKEHWSCFKLSKTMILRQFPENPRICGSKENQNEFSKKIPWAALFEIQWIGLREHLQENPMISSLEHLWFPVKIFPKKPIHFTPIQLKKIRENHIS